MRKGRPRYKTEEVSSHYRPAVEKRGASHYFRGTNTKVTPQQLKKLRIGVYRRRDFRKSGPEHSDALLKPRNKDRYRKL